MIDNYPNGYYWAEHTADQTRFIVLREDGNWYCCGLYDPIDIDPNDILAPVQLLEGWKEETGLAKQ